MRDYLAASLTERNMGSDGTTSRQRCGGRMALDISLHWTARQLISIPASGSSRKRCSRPSASTFPQADGCRWTARPFLRLDRQLVDNHSESIEFTPDSTVPFAKPPPFPGPVN